MLEWKKMWEVTTWDKKFYGLDKFMQPNVIKYHYYLANELQDLEDTDGDIRILYTTDKIAFVKEEDVLGTISKGEVVTIPWGGNLSIKYYNGRFVTADNRIATSNDVNYLSNKFLFYWMLSQYDVISSFYRGAGIKHPSMQSVLNLDIPIPPLFEQNRIVTILDTFTTSIDNLKEQIELRRKQFEHYRNKLLDLEGKEGVEMKKLKDACEIRRGIRVVKKQLKDNALYPVFQNSIAPMGYYDQYNRDGDMPYIICAGSSSGSVGYCYTPFWAADDCFTIEGRLVRRYIYYALKKNNNNLFNLVRKGSMPRLPHEAIDNMVIPVPSLTEQQRIVVILDKFEASIKNLEAQLDLRQKQYEYYRNKLLTFE